MRIRKAASGVLILCGGVLILLSFRAELFFDVFSTQFYNLSEAGLIYGLLLASLGIVLMFSKKMSILQFLWVGWIGLMGIQLVRVLPVSVLVSHFMSSTKIFWSVIGFGFLLSIISICKKIKEIL